MNKSSSNINSSMYHETRKQDNRLKALSREAKRQAEKSRDEYLKNRRDPYETLMVIGTGMDIHKDSHLYNVVHNDNRLGKEVITYDQYDGRATLDDFPEETSVKYDYTLERQGEDKELEILLNFERYRILVEAYKTTANEQKLIENTEQKVNTTLVSHSKFGSQVSKSTAIAPKKEPKTYAQYGFNYEQPHTSDSLFKEIVEEKIETRIRSKGVKYNVIIEEENRDFPEDDIKKHVYGGEIFEEKGDDDKKSYKERRRISKQNFKDKVEIKRLQNYANTQDDELEYIPEDKPVHKPEQAISGEKIFITEFDLDEQVEESELLNYGGQKDQRSDNKKKNQGIDQDQTKTSSFQNAREKGDERYSDTNKKQEIMEKLLTSQISNAKEDTKKEPSKHEQTAKFKSGRQQKSQQLIDTNLNKGSQDTGLFKKRGQFNKFQRDLSNSPSRNRSRAVARHTPSPIKIDDQIKRIAKERRPFSSSSSSSSSSSHSSSDSSKSSFSSRSEDRGHKLRNKNHRKQRQKATKRDRRSSHSRSRRSRSKEKRHSTQKRQNKLKSVSSSSYSISNSRSRSKSAKKPRGKRR